MFYLLLLFTNQILLFIFPKKLRFQCILVLTHILVMSNISVRNTLKHTVNIYIIYIYIIYIYIPVYIYIYIDIYIYIYIL